MSNIWIVIPAFNEAKNIRNVVRELRSKGYRVVAIDDCSKDGTTLEALAGGAVVLRHVRNLGQGGALRTGIRFAIDQGASHIVTFDGDGQHDVKDIETLVEALNSNTADVALGSRFLGTSPEGMPATRRLLLKLAVHFTRISSGLAVTDTHNGFRAFTAEAAGKIDIFQMRMAHASEILNEIGRKNLKFVEVPVLIRYSQESLQNGQSSLNSLNILFELAKKKFIK